SGTLLLFLGRYSMAIYLFNTIAIGLAKAALIRAGVVWSAAGATAAVPVLMLAGVAGPILAKTLILRHIAPLDRITD
ncbi:MAG: acyltransferase, partial [Acetobacteraceae bacterium]|nr:acyltransferase [Acetobacteraceae bacterium]